MTQENSDDSDHTLTQDLEVGCNVTTCIFQRTEHTHINMADCDSDNNSDSLLPQESQDLFQESQDLFADDFLLPPTDIIRDDPLQEESSPKISLTCEEYLKDFTTDESIDSDPTPDLEIATTSNCDKDDKNEESNDSVKMKKWPILKLNMTQENSDDSDHTLTQDLEVGCNVTTCTFPHILAYNQSKQEDQNDNNDSSQQYITPPLDDFMNMSLEIFGKDIIEEISYHRHKIRDYQKILINDYNISPGTVENWINSL